jgi:hypothetical protein
MLSRRGILVGSGTLLITSPAIVRVSSLMPVKTLDGLRWIKVTDALTGEVIRTFATVSGSRYSPWDVWNPIRQQMWMSYDHDLLSNYVAKEGLVGSLTWIADDNHD